jgi:hypothetical protein
MAASPQNIVNCWTGDGIAVECARDVLTELRKTARSGYLAMPHRSVEIGGVLFGKAAPHLIRIQKYTPVTIEYAHGPRFVLSKRDEIAFRGVLKSEPLLDPVGFYISHDVSSAELPEADRSIFDRFFHNTGLVAFVLNPSRTEDCRITCYVRESQDHVVALSSQEVRTEAPLEPPVQAPVAVKAVRAPAPLTSTHVPRSVRPGSKRWLFAAALVPVAVAASAAWVWLRPLATPLPPLHPPPPITAPPIARSPVSLAAVPANNDVKQNGKAKRHKSSRRSRHSARH